MIANLRLAVAALLLVHCVPAELRDPGPLDAGPPPCPAHVDIECEGGVPGPTTCTGDPKATDRKRFLPADIGYAQGCFAFFQKLECSTEGYCYCSARDAGAARWICPE